MGSLAMSVLKQGHYDQTFLGNVYCSTFKHDYNTRAANTKKQAMIEPQAPAKIQHTAAGVDMSSSVSMARHAFPDPTSKAEATVKNRTLYDTNFKLGHKEPCSGRTVMKDFFQPRRGAKVLDITSIKNKWMSADVPNGDPEKNNLNKETLYAHQFKNYSNHASAPEKLGNTYVTHIPDPLSHNEQRFQTLAQQNFPAHTNNTHHHQSHAEASFERGCTSVPQGDINHDRVKNSFGQVTLRSVYPSYRRNAILDARIYRSNFVDRRYTTSIKMGDNRLRNNRTEQSGRYMPIPVNQMYPLQRTNIERNHSDVPQGDSEHHMDSTMHFKQFKSYF